MKEQRRVKNKDKRQAELLTAQKRTLWEKWFPKNLKIGWTT